MLPVHEDRWRIAPQLITQAEAKNPKLFPMKVTRDGFLAGVFAGVILHETGHALFDVLDVPIMGREEDAADEISTFVALQFQPKLADVVVAAYADVGETFGNPPTEAPDAKAADYPKDKTLTSASPTRSAPSPTCTAPGGSASTTRCA